MRLTTAEFGSFWFFEAAARKDRGELPPRCQARVETAVEELDGAGADELAAATNHAAPASFRERLAHGRRCLCLRVDGQIAAYGWISMGPERAGELEREFNLRHDEAYVWDCVTLPAWRRQGLYSALLSHIIYRLSADGVPRIWIGASRQNRPSIKGIANAGFGHVVDLVYRRISRLTLLWFRASASAPPGAVSNAYDILLQPYERRFGRLALGWHPG
jgi:GNAT superfamily N-acetyltransferase